MLDVICCSPAMIGVGGAAEAAASVASFARNGCRGGIPSTPSIVIDFTPITFSPKAEAAISALLFAFATACSRGHF
jgi:hypothetical protein